MEHGLESAVRKWTTPQCPFEIEYSSRVLDDIRLSVVDAFFSLPRGGAEIGGILLGKHEGNLITVSGFEPLDCEHAMGPSFNLSPRDQTLLAEMTARAKRNPVASQPVGWYHSHTRSEIFLSDADLEIHNRFFPEPWQVALVLKPHTFQPTRGGFFFRGPDGAIHSTASYQEFVLEPMPLKPHSPVPGGSSLRIPRDHGTANGPVPESAPLPNSEASGTSPKEKGRVPITREIAVAPSLTNHTDGNRIETESDVHSFNSLEDDRPWPMVKVAVILAVLLMLAGAAYQTRQWWYPGVITKIRPMLPKDADGYVSLSVKDENGQLNILWDKTAPAIQHALDATLQIGDGHSVPRTIHLDTPHLLTGAFRFARETEQVDVALTVTGPNGAEVREQASFLGSLPKAADDPQSRKERDALTEKADKLQKDLNFQASKTKKLEKDLKEMQDQIDQKRHQDQTGDATKKR